MTLGDAERVPARSDAGLTAAIRAGSAGDAELTELYRRHRPAVLAYARTCCRDSHTAEDLTSEAFVRTIQAVRSGRGPETAWRPYLLAAVRRIATDWGGAAGRIELSPDFEQWLQTAPTEESGEEQLIRQEDNDLVLEGFRALPERWQAVLWHSVVEEEPAAEVGAMLGIGASGVASLAARAREGLREAYLTAHAQSRTTSEECRRYSALLGAAVRRSGRRPDRHLDHHLADCARCRRAKFELTDLNQRLRSVLPAGVLLWGGHAYLAARHTAAALTAATTPRAGSGGSSRKAAAWSLGAATVAVVLAVGFGSGGAQPGHAQTQATPAPAPTPSPTTPPAPPSPSSSAQPSLGSTQATPSSTPVPTELVTSQADVLTRLRIVSTGNCMEIPGGTRTSGAAPHEAACDGAPEQQWQLLVSKDRKKVQLRNAATQLCLANSGTSKDGAPVEQTACDPTSVTQLWQPSGSTKGGRVSFVDQSGQMFLGLNDWWHAGQGMPHNTTVGTTHDYYGTTSLAFLYDGAPFGG